MKSNNTIPDTGIPKKHIEPFTEILLDLVGVCNKDNGIKALWLSGSRAIGKHKPDSDLDLVFIVNADGAKESLKETLKQHLLYKKHFDYFFNKVFEYWEFNKNEVGVHIYSHNEIQSKVETIFSSFKSFEAGQSFVQHNIINATAMFDPNKILVGLKKQASYPENLRREQAEISLKRIRQEVEWWHIRKNWRSIFEEIHVIKLLIDEIAKCQYALNSRYYMVALKYYTWDQGTLTPDISNELEVLATMNPTKDSNAIKRTALDSILTKLMKEYMRIYAAKEIKI